MAAVAFLLDPEWTPSVVVHTPVLTDNPGRHLMRYVTAVRRDPILRDFVAKLERHAAQA